MACFPSAGTASEPLTEAPDVGRALVCDGPCAQGVFRNYMLVSKSVLLRAHLPGYYSTQLFPGVPSTQLLAVFLCVFKHSAHVVPALLSS